MHTLTPSERIQLVGLQAREREAMREVMEPLKADYRVVLSEIEDRLMLDAGAIGTTHVVEQANDGLMVREATDEDKAPEAWADPLETAIQQP